VDPIFLVIEPDYRLHGTVYELSVGDRRVRMVTTRESEMYLYANKPGVIVRELVQKMAADYRNEIETQLRRVGAL
jgi:hypothetical protein